MERSIDVLLTADTHVPDFARALPRELLRAAADADLVVHAGDVTAPAVLEQLATHAPVVAVAGNNDGPAIRSWGAEEELRLDLDGVPTGVVHDAGPRKGRAGRMRRRFAGARLVLYGHSHIPLDEDDGDVRLVNPGSPTWKRRQPAPTFAWITVVDGRVDVAIVALDAMSR